MHQDRKAVPLYLAATLAFSSVFYFLIIRSGHLAGAFGMYVAGLMWCPAAGAFLTCKLTGREIRSLGWKWGKARYQAFSYVIPPAYATVTYAVVWITGLGRLYSRKFVDEITRGFGLGALPPGVSIVLYLALASTAGMVFSCSSALGEEIGWRGFLVPELARRMNFGSTALVSGCIWSLPDPHLRRLQRGHSHLVRAHLLHGPGRRDQLHLRLDAPAIGELMDGRAAPREPQPFHSAVL